MLISVNICGFILAKTAKNSPFLTASMFRLQIQVLFQEPEVDLGDSGDILVLTSVMRKDGGIYQCRPQDEDAASEVRGEMQLNVHCEEDTPTRTTLKCSCNL